MLLLLGDTHDLTATAGGASVLSTDTDAVGVTDTTMATHLAETLDIVTELGGDGGGGDVLDGTGLGVTLTVQEPGGDLVLLGISNDVGDLLALLGGEGTGATVDVDVGLLADHVGEADSDTTEDAEREGDLALAVDVGVQQTHDVLERSGLKGKGHVGNPKMIKSENREDK